MIESEEEFHELVREVGLRQAFKELARSDLDPNSIDFSGYSAEHLTEPLFKYLRERAVTTVDLLEGSDIAQWVMVLSWRRAAEEYIEQTGPMNWRSSWSAWKRFAAPAYEIHGSPPPKAQGPIGSEAFGRRQVWVNTVSMLEREILEAMDSRASRRLAGHVGQTIGLRFDQKETLSSPEKIALSVGHFRQMMTTVGLAGHPWELVLGDLS
jgi:hypothetical protein